MAIGAQKFNAKRLFASPRIATLSATIVICLLITIFGSVISRAAPAPPQGPGQGPGEPQRWVNMLPGGKGRDIVAGNCILCHTVERIVTSHRPRAAWEALVKLMALRGCPIDDEQVATVIDYVSKNFGPARKEAAAAQPTNPSQYDRGSEATASPDRN
jgi:hypothetical protein